VLMNSRTQGEVMHKAPFLRYARWTLGDMS